MLTKFTVAINAFEYCEGVFDTRQDAEQYAVELVNRDYQEDFQSYDELADSGLDYAVVMRLNVEDEETTDED